MEPPTAGAAAGAVRPWGEIGAPDRDGPRSSWRVVTRAVPGVLLAAVLYLIGLEIAAMAVVVAVVVLTVATIASKRAEDLVLRVIAAIAHWVGRILSAVLMGLVNLLVVLPAWVIGRVFSVDVLHSDRTGVDRWSPRPDSARRLQRREFAEEPLRHDQTSAARTRRSPVLRVVRVLAVLFVLDLVVGAVFNRLTIDSTVEFDWQDSGVFDEEPWAGTMFNEVYARPAILDPYEPFIEWDAPDFEGQFVNVDGGERRTYRPTLAANGPEPVDIWFFGGSALFGYGQRDDHTIPSEVARLAEQDGVPVRVRNYGAAGYVNWQGVLKLQQILIAGEEPPDLVVFYDGWNDLDMQVRFPEPGFNHRYTEDMRRRLQGLAEANSGYDEWATIRKAYILRSLTAQLIRRVDGALSDEPIAEEYSLRRYPADERVANTMEGMERGADLAARLGESYGFATMVFWQPYLESSPGQADQDDLVDDIPGYEFVRPVWQRMTPIAQEEMPPSIIDLSDAVDDLDDPVFYDQVHTNEAGAAAIAAALYEHLTLAVRVDTGP